MKYIDTHAHITSEYFKEDLSETIKNANQLGIKYIFVPGTTIEDSFKALSTSAKYDCIYAGFGIHPSDSSAESTLKMSGLNFEGFKFIGETGIDLYHDSNPSLETQTASFIKHLELAKQLNIPIEIHTRDAYQEVYDIIKNFVGIKFIMHSFTGNLKWANAFIELGAYISFSGIVTFKNARDVQEVARNIPIERMLIETDSPFLAPSPHRGKNNKPEYVKHIGDFLEGLRGPGTIEQIYHNTIDLFNIV